LRDAEEITFPISPLQEITHNTDTMALSYLTKGMLMDNYKQFCRMTVSLISQVASLE